MSRPVAASSDEHLFAVCGPGLERVLADECRQLGATRVTEARGGVELEGPRGVHRRLNLQLRSATRVLLQVAQVRARDASQLERALFPDLARTFAAPDTAVTIDVHAKGSGLKDASAVGRTIAQRWRLRRADEGLPLTVRVEGDQVTISVDTSGEPLYLRGYRQELSRAPLRETLAAGLLHLAGYDGRETLWDPMCGSGTIPIEAAWLATNRAPGLTRSFAFERFPSHELAAWEREKREASLAQLPRPPAPIRATDVNAGSVGVARRNARRAEVELHLERMDLLHPKMSSELKPGLLIANLPYGIRVGDDIDTLYRQLAPALKTHFAGWRIGLLFPDDDRLESLLSVPEAAQRHPVDNGGIHCRIALWTQGVAGR